MPWNDILWGIAAPAVLAGVFFGGSALVFRNSAVRGPQPFAIALGLGLPILLAFGQLIGWPKSVPTNVLERFFYLIETVAFLGCLETILYPTHIYRQIQALIFASGTLVPLFILWSQLSFKAVEGSNTSTTQSWYWVFGVGLGVAVLTLLTDWLARRTPGAQYPFCWWLIMAGTAGALLVSASAKGFQLAGALAAALGAAVVAGLLWKDFTFSPGGTRVFIFALSSLVLFGNQFAKLPVSSAVLLALAPLFAGVGELPGFKKLKPWQLTLVRLMSCAVPVGIAVYLAFKANPVEDNPYA